MGEPPRAFGGTDRHSDAAIEFLSTEVARLDGKTEATASAVADLPAAIAAAARDGVKEALASPDTWATAIAAMREQAKTHAGSWLLGGIGAVVSRAMWVAVIGMGVYLIGGWSALATLGKAILGDGAK